MFNKFQCVGVVAAGVPVGVYALCARNTASSASPGGGPTSTTVVVLNGARTKVSVSRMHTDATSLLMAAGVNLAVV